jgi:hypothetical protein
MVSVISGKGAAYENSFLTFQNRPEAGWFCGRIEAPEIHDLAKNFDDPKRDLKKNPSRIVSRDRSGLNKEHLYYKSICAAINKSLEDLFEKMALEEGAQRKQGANLSSTLNSISPQLAKALQNLLEEDEWVNYPISDTGNVVGDSLSIIPPKRLLSVGQCVALTIQNTNKF